MNFFMDSTLYFVMCGMVLPKVSMYFSLRKSATSEEQFLVVVVAFMVLNSSSSSSSR